MQNVKVAVNDETRKAIEAHIEIILRDSSFRTRKSINPDRCPCYAKGGESCHPSIPEEELICLFCLCLHYDNRKEEGGCRIGSEDGEFVKSSRTSTSRIWDCSGCDYPHRAENVRSLLRRFYELE